ncbi:MAG: hypothetical protein V1748_09035 [Actinomycetota bacterium]
MGTFLRILGIVAIVLGTLIWVAVLPFMARALKKLNKSLSERARGVRGQVDTSVAQIEEAQAQIQALAAGTELARASIESAIASADRVVGFLQSGTFQVGLPIVLWFGLLVVAIPRAIVGVRRRRTRIVLIPPPSWEQETD